MYYNVYGVFNRNFEKEAYVDTKITKFGKLDRLSQKVPFKIKLYSQVATTFY